MTTRIRDELWEQLQDAARAPRGVSWRRLAPESLHNLFVAVAYPGSRRELWYDLPAAAIPEDLQLPSLRSVHVSIRPLDGSPELVRVNLELEDASLNGVFTALVNDIVATVEATRDYESGLAALIARMDRWRRLMRLEGATGLTPQERRGLFGELIVMEQLLENVADAHDVLRTWTGPYAANQDFQLEQVAVEVKTTAAKQPQSLVIASERELDRQGIGRLFLEYISLDERRGGEGRTLPGLVGQLRASLQDDDIALQLLEEGLLHVGYLDAHAREYV